MRKLLQKLRQRRALKRAWEDLYAQVHGESDWDRRDRYRSS